MTSNNNWENNLIQFPRLIAEIQETGAFDLRLPGGDRVIDAVAESMDLDVSQVYELVDRAVTEWDRIKSVTFQPDPVDPLIKTHGTWGEHPKYVRADWRREVAEGDTNLGYWEWILQQQEIFEDE